MKEALPDEKDEDVAEIKEKLTINTESKSLLTLSYSDEDKDRTESVLNAISSTFLKTIKSCMQKEKPSSAAA